MRYKATYLIVIGLVLISLGMVASRHPQIALAPETPIVETPKDVKPIEEPVKETPLKSEGVLVLRLLDTGRLKNISIMPVKVLEDSRCPSDVDCIWAGQIRIEAEVVGKEAVSNVFTVGSAFSFEGYKITLQSADPYPVSTKRIGEKEYKLTFKVEKEKDVAAGKCYVGGCSGQVCSDTPGMASTCEYREVYGCYQGETCERQSDGKCGWTETPALRSCIMRNSTSIDV